MNAKRTGRTMARSPRPEDGLTCRDCAHARDFHNRSIADGHWIFCRCAHQEHSMFLNHDRCGHFAPKKNKD